MTKISPTVLSFLVFISLTLTGTKINAQLKAGFTVYSDSVCTQIADSFTNTTTGGTKPYHFVWDFGNGSHSTLSDCNALYAFKGSYRVTLYATDANGKTDSFSKTIKVLGAPIADHSAKVMYCYITYFQAAEDINSPTPIKSYFWMGEGSPGHGPLYRNGQTSSYFYTEGGTYHFSLLVKGANGCSTIYNDSIKISSYPGILLPNSTSVCTNTTLSITATVIGGTAPYRIWWWDSSLNITGPTITQTITKDTAFAVYLSDANGCFNYDSMKVKAIPLPDAKWTLNYEGNDVIFYALDSSMADSNYHWFFGDGNGAAGHKADHIYSKKQDFGAGLIVENNAGCFNKYDSTIYIDKALIGNNSDIISGITFYPNPFNSSTNLVFTLSQKSHVQIGLFDITGKQIAFICNEIRQPGNYQLSIDASKYNLSPGIYTLKLLTDEGIKNLNIVKL